MNNDKEISHGFAIIRAVIDDLRGQSIAIGVAAWDAEAEWFDVRHLESDERIAGFNANRRFLADVAVSQIRMWAERKSVPYGPGSVEPWRADFWASASRVMSSAIRVDPPRAMVPMVNPDVELDSLFQAVVQPLQHEHKSKRRIDACVTSALGMVAKLFQSGVDVPAFAGRNEQVMRRALGVEGTVVIEGVNLASSTARKDADALVSKLLRIMASDSGKSVRPVVGYVTSPGGLNGEADLTEWIRLRVTENVFDLVTQEGQFRSVTQEQLSKVGVSITGDLKPY